MSMVYVNNVQGLRSCMAWAGDLLVMSRDYV